MRWRLTKVFKTDIVVVIINEKRICLQRTGSLFLSEINKTEQSGLYFFSFFLYPIIKLTVLLLLHRIVIALILKSI